MLLVVVLLLMSAAEDFLFFIFTAEKRTTGSEMAEDLQSILRMALSNVEQERDFADVREREGRAEIALLADR